MENYIPDDIKSFIFKYIMSIEHLEILNYFINNPHNEYDAFRVNQELKTNVISIDKKMNELYHKGFLIIKDREKKIYQYSAGTILMDMEARRVCQFYKENYHTVINLIYSRPL